MNTQLLIDAAKKLVADDKGLLAMVTDSKLLGELPKIAAHLVHVQVKHFSESQHDDALRWLKEGTPVSP